MSQFLPVTKKDMEARGWEQLDFVYVTGDAYVDHSSFGSSHHQPSSGEPGLQGGNHPPAGLETAKRA